MANKKLLDYMYNIAISNSGDFEKADKVRECYNKIADDLEVLEILREGFVREGRIITYKGFNQKNWDKVEEWLNEKD